MTNSLYTHADNNSKYFQSRQTLVTKEGRLQSGRFYSDKVSISFGYDAISRGLTQKDIYYFAMIISQHLKSDSILYCYDKQSRCQKPMTRKDLQAILELSDSAFKHFFSRCKKANVLKIHKWISNNDMTRNVIYVNPAFIQPSYSITVVAYWLFKEDLDKRLDDTTVAMFTDEYYRQYGTFNHNKADEFFLKDEEEIEESSTSEKESFESIFKEYVLNNKEADVYSFDGFNQFFLANESSEYGKRSAGNIVTYRNMFIDIDAGKDKNGKYFNLEEVAKRKVDMLAVIHSFGLVPTMITETRNGFHCIWSIEETSSDEWLALESKLIDTFAIADKAVCDSSRVLRMPYTTWRKGNEYSDYEVMIYDANAVRYSIKDFESGLTDFEGYVKAACEEYLTKYPEVKPESRIQKSHNHKPATISDTRILAISKLQAVSVDTQDVRTMTINEFKSYAKTINLADFLGLPGCQLFRCILHDDNIASANIIGNEVDGYRYYCFSPNCAGHDNKKGADIFNVVQELSGMPFSVVLDYLAKLFNVSIRKVA